MSRLFLVFDLESGLRWLDKKTGPDVRAGFLWSQQQRP